MLGLQYFSFDDLWSPLILALFLIIAADLSRISGSVQRESTGRRASNYRTENHVSRRSVRSISGTSGSLQSTGSCNVQLPHGEHGIILPCCSAIDDERFADLGMARYCALVRLLASFPSWRIPL